jgi:nitrite reductase/ring-hydroxylating ferredoxin subunit
MLAWQVGSPVVLQEGATMTDKITELKIPEGYRYVCDLDTVPERGKHTVTIDDVRILIVACENGHYALEDRCPRTGNSVAHGSVIERTLTIPATGERYDLRTGRYVSGGQLPRQSETLAIWPLHIIDGKVYVRPPSA